MLSSADKELCDRDRTGEALRAVLNDESREELVGELFGASHQVGYLRLKPGAGFVAGISMGRPATDDSPVRSARFGFIQAIVDADSPKLDKLSEFAQAHDLTSSLAVHSERGIVAGFEVADRTVPGINRIFDTTAEQDGLRYKPFRRWVGRVITRKGKQRFVKAYSLGQVPDVSIIQELIAARVNTPAVRSLRQTRGIAAFDWSYGTPYDGMPQRSPEIDHAVGIELARVHRSTPKREAGPEWANGKVTELRASAAAIGVLAPAHAERISDLVEQLVATLFAKETGLELVRVHGDFSIDQVLLERKGRIALVDFDRSGFDEFELDLATWFATEIMHEIRGHRATDLAMFHALLRGYATEAGISISKRFRPLVAAQLVHLAVTPFRSRWHDWDTAISRFVDRIETVLEEQWI